MSKFNEIINSERPVLIDFSAEWCQPCKMMPPVLEEVKRQFGDKIRILKVDVDKNPAISQKWMIRNVPTLMIFRKGEMKFRQAGMVQAPRLSEIIREFL